MQVTAYKTPLVTSGDDVLGILKNSLPKLEERSVVVVASKIFSAAEGRFVAKTADQKTEKHDLARREAEWYLDPHSSKYNLMLTIKRNWIFANAGIDESNADGQYLLWPSDPQASVNAVWEYLRTAFSIKELGVTMSDSGSIPLNWGITGHAIAYCGFQPLKSYIGKEDLFGRELQMEQVNVAQSLTAAAVLEMGEGAEQTPVAVVENIGEITFQDHVPTPAELAALHIDLEDDAFAPILTQAQWHKGGGGTNV